MYKIYIFKCNAHAGIQLSVRFWEGNEMLEKRSSTENIKEEAVEVILVQ